MAIETPVTDILQSLLLKTASADREQDALKQLHRRLTNKIATLDEHGDNSRSCTPITSNGIVCANPYADKELVTVIKNQDTLDKFICYVFERRYGWSEADKVGSRRVRKISSTGATLTSSDGQQKAIINDLLDNLIKWILSQEISLQLLQSFCCTLRKVTEMPVVRNRTVIHLMEWLKGNKDSLRERNTFPVILTLINMALSDVWSAIRSSCAKQLGQIYTSFGLQDQELLFSSLAKNCTADDSSWQAREGAIMGISSILHQYKDGADSRSHTPIFSLHSPSQDYSNNIVPQFISQRIHFVVFKLLSDQQLTIRENAAKALSTFISCSDVNEASSTFSKVMEQLQRGVVDTTHHLENGDGDGKNLQQDSRSQLSQDVRSLKLPLQFLDAFAAEGLLNVCQFLVKVLPLHEILPQWPQHIHTFLLYLSHPASTVRQVASSVFMCVVLKCSHFGVLVKLVLQSLVEGWDTDVSVLQREERDFMHSVQGEKTLPSVCDDKEVPLCQTWESREGRLFAFELIMKFLIKNHWVYTFGPAGAGLLKRENSSGECQDDGQDSSSDNTLQPRHKRIHSISEANESQNDEDKKNSTESEAENSLTLHFKSQGSLAVKTIPEQSTHTSSQNSSPFNTTFSLLTQIQHLDSSNNNKDDAGTSPNNQTKFTTGLMQALTDKRISVKENWMQDVKLLEFKALLSTVLYQTLECLADPRWELRRMAQQVLPCLAEVIRWYDISLLEDFWRKHLSKKTCLLTYGAVLLLKESVTHSVILQKLLLKPPSTWQNPELCKSIISRITDTMRCNVPVLLPYLDKLIQRPMYDKLSVAAATTIIISHTHFSIQSEQRVSQIATVLSFWKLLFCFCHANTRICKELLVNGMDLKLFTSPFEGYLSCCLVRPENKLQCAKQVEKCFIGEIHHEIKNFLQGLPVESISTLLPILAHYTGLLLEDTHICKALADCLSSVGSRIVEYILSVRNEEQRKICLKCLHLTLKELAAIITMKSSELHLIQKVLNCYLMLCKPINPVKHIRMILVAICSRISEGIYFSMEHSPRPDDDLSLLSNDIPLSNSTESLNELDLDDPVVVIGSPNTFPECLTLNLSNNSVPSGRLSAQSQYSDRGMVKSPPPSEDGDDSSDWDSWDEDQSETQTALSTAFGEFLQKLRKMCDNASRDVFGLEMKKLETKERSLIREILD